MSHTPGPWQAARAPHGVMDIFNANGQDILTLYRDDEETQANARLIAAAPTMLDALHQAEACMSIVEPRSDKAEYLRILGVVRAAIAATGEKA